MTTADDEGAELDAGMEVDPETGGVVLAGGLQSKPMLWIPIEQSPLDPCGNWNSTALAPPHWVFFTMEPPVLQEAVCLQVEPSFMW